MRLVVYGAGAVGGVVAGRLAEAGHHVVVIARGAHAAAMRASGLRVESPEGAVVVDVPVVEHPAEVAFAEGDVVLLGVKSHDTVGALRDLRRAMALDLPVVCLQNGVENERAALRLFPDVYGISVMCPTGYLEPGVVQAYSSPTTGILDVGRYPTGTDELAEAVAGLLRSAGFESEPRADIMRWKYAKLVLNLGNAIEAVCGPPARQGEIGRLAKAEGVACLRAAGIEFASDEEDLTRRGDLVTMRPVGGRRREGGSSWQSLRRATGSIETDYLNGEIVLLGRRHGVPTPVNALLQRLANELAAARAEPGAVTEAAFLARLP